MLPPMKIASADKSIKTLEYLGSGWNGTNLRPVWDAALTGQGSFFTESQGSFATLGWRTKPALGLKLVPFGSVWNGAKLTGFLDDFRV